MGGGGGGGGGGVGRQRFCFFMHGRVPLNLFLMPGGVFKIIYFIHGRYFQRAPENICVGVPVFVQ